MGKQSYGKQMLESMNIALEDIKQRGKMDFSTSEVLTVYLPFVCYGIAMIADAIQGWSEPEKGR